MKKLSLLFLSLLLLIVSCKKTDDDDDPNIIRLETDLEISDFIWRGLNQYYYWQESCLLYTSPSPRDRTRSRMPSSA